MAERYTCSDCRWFRPEPGAVVSPFAIASEKLEMVRPPSTSADSHPVTYGHCQATFPDGEGMERRYNHGQFEISPCNATDDQGNRLYSPKG